MHRVEMEGLFTRLPEIRILVVGDLMLDEYLWGQTDRISPEAPVPVVDVNRQELRLGGAGNVLNNLTALGCQVRVVSVLGDDADGTLLKQLLLEQGLNVEMIHAMPGRATSRKTRVLATNQQMIRVDRESRAPIDADVRQILVTSYRQALVDADVVLISDYGKGLLTNEFLRQIIDLARDCQVPVLVDPKGEDFSKYEGASLITPNRKEALTAAGRLDAAGDDLLEIGAAMRKALSLDALLITRSEEGMSLFTGQAIHHLQTEAREVYDVSGAGDTVIAVLAAAVGSGVELVDAADVANLAAGVVVGKVGTSTVSAEEILAAAGRRHADTDLKLTDRSVLSAKLANHKAAGQKVVFTNGCFDLLHVGHVKYLQAARRLGDLLVLGLNSDASIQRLKGPKRPLIGQDERAHILAALDCIDYVVLFDEDTPLELIGLLRPDILVKGGDYTPEGVVGRELVESYGGRVELIQFVDGKSTTNIINKVLESYQE